MMKTLIGAGLAALLAVTVAQAQSDPGDGKVTDPTGGDASSEIDINKLGPALTVEGTLGSGEECAVIRTTDGKTYGVEGDIDATDVGQRVRVSGNIDPSANFCLDVKEVILVEKLEKL